ncbi:lipopolysaccharide biosynthesis protein RfbH, partial [Streptomyces sp. SID11233]|nr:lipopolysaccharide biosynthesis protein RfbH [Streptomyces sp. SID11233]
GFVLTVEPDAPFSRRALVDFLEQRRIGTRRFFGGNLTRHPAYLNRRHRISGDLANCDLITENTFWVGVFPGLTTEMIDYVVDTIKEFVASA